MNGGRRWALLTGPKGSNKSALLAQAITELSAQGVRVGGFAQQALQKDGGRGGYEVLHLLGAKERLRMARTGTPAAASEEAFCDYVFDRDVFTAARAWIAEDLARSDLLVIDEVSKLEAAGQGHAESVTAALAAGEPVLLSVRADQLAPVMERFGLDSEPIATLSTDAPEGLQRFVETIRAAAIGGLRAGEIDWAARIAEMVAASRRGEVPHLDDPWRKRAARFARMSRERPTEPLMQVLGPMLRPTDVVADIGAGAGRHVLELSPRVAQVIAIEPSAAMRAHLEARIAEERLGNVTVVAEPWPGTQLDRPVDVMFSSHVLYAVEDAQAFLQAMSGARRLAALLLSPRPPCTALDGLWTAIHGVPRPRPPGALEAAALLWQLGQRAELRLLPGTEREMIFRAEGEDLVELCHRLGIADDQPGLARVRAALERHGRLLDDGAYAVGRMGPHLLVSWALRAGSAQP